MTLLDKQANKRRTSVIRAVVVFVVVLSCFVCSTTVFAFAAQTEAAFKSSYMSQIHKVYNLFTSMMLPISAVGFASSCFTCLMGTPHDVEKATKRILTILIAVASLYMLPAVISTAMAIFSRYTYTPPRS